MKSHKVSRRKLCWIEAAPESFAKRMKQTPSDKGNENIRKFSKDSSLLSVPIANVLGFCAIKRSHLRQNYTSYCSHINLVSKNISISQIMLSKQLKKT